MNARRPSPWLLPALVCAAMLILPALTWLLAPRAARIERPAASSAAPAAADPEPEPFSPRPVRATRPARAVDSAASAPAGPVTGMVVDPDGRPAKGAFVGCDDRDQTLATSTDDEGRFQLAAEASGCLAVARHPDFVGSERVAIVAGRSNTLRLNRGGGIEGDVVDERGAPVAAFALAVESYQGPSSDGAPIGQVKSIRDPRGVFAWENLVPGKYVLTASGDGRPPARSRQVDVDAGRTTAHVRITLARGATLSGRVVDAATRKPIAGALVAYDRTTVTRADPTRPARTDEQGAYTLEGAPAGPFSIRVSHEGHRARIVPGLVTRGAAAIKQDVELNPMVDGGPTGDDFAGIGAFLGAVPNGVSFLSFVAGSPAQEAGLRAGDVIRRIDGVDASAFTIADCMQSLRGPDGSRVAVQVERAGQRIDVTIQRRGFTL